MTTKLKRRMDNVYSGDDYLAAVKRRSRVFLVVALAVVSVAALVAFVLPDEYRSVARISINLQGAYIKTLQPIQVAAYADQYIAELSDRVLSLDNLRLFYQENGTASGTGSNADDQDPLGVLRDSFYFSLETQPVMSEGGREVDIISGFIVGAIASDPEFAFRAASFFSERFLTEDRKSRTERASSTSAFLTEQINQTEIRIVEHEQEIAAFKVKNACCLPELRELNMSAIQRAERDIENLQPRIRTLEQDRVFLQSQLDEIRQRSGTSGQLESLEQEYQRLVASYGPEHPDVMRVRREIDAINRVESVESNETLLEQLRAQLVEAERKYSDIHPDVRSLKQEIATLEQGMANNVPGGQDRLLEDPRYLQLRAATNAIDTELAELRRRGPELRQMISDYEQRLARTPQIESEYQALNRKLDTARENFNSLQQRLVTARQTEALESAEIGARLIEVQSAYLPDSPSGPARIGIIVFGVMFAIGLGIASIFVAEMLDSTVRGSSDVAAITDMIPVASIPVIQNSVSAAAFRKNAYLAASLLLALVAGVAAILLLNS